MTEIKHADQLTRVEFKKLMKDPKTWYWLIGAAIVIGVVVSFWAYPGAGVLAGIGTVLAGIFFVYTTAGEKAEDAFYDHYAKSRGLQRSPKQMGPATPLLRKGDKRRTDEMFSGKLNDEFQGSLVLYTYIEITRDNKGNKQEHPHPFTLVTIKLPKFAEHMPELVVEEQGFKIFDKLEDAFKGNLERIRLESEALDERFQIFVRKDQDPVWIRRLFSPSFMVYLTDHPMRDFAFEFGSGRLVAYLPKHKESDAEFDGLIAATCELAAKLNAEALQTQTG